MYLQRAMIPVTCLPDNQRVRVVLAAVLHEQWTVDVCQEHGHDLPGHAGKRRCRSFVTTNNLAGILYR